MKLIFILLLFSVLAESRVIDIIDKREFEFEDFRFEFANNGRVFNIDSSKAALYSEIDSMQYIKDAGFILTAYSGSKDVMLSNIYKISSATINPGIAKYGTQIDSTNKEKYQVYHSKDYDEFGQPLFGEQIPAWPVYSQKREIDNRSIPSYIDQISERKSEDLFCAYYLGEEDIFSVYKIFDAHENIIQVENLISLFKNRIIISYKLINSGNKLDSCLFSFYLDADITNFKRIFQDIYDDEITLGIRPYLSDLNNNKKLKSLTATTLHYPETDDNLEIIHPFFGTNTNGEYYVFSLFDNLQKFSDIRNYQLHKSEEVPNNYGDARILINNESFNFDTQDTAFFAYSINFADNKENLNQTYLEIEEDISQSKELFKNLFTTIKKSSKPQLSDEFHIYSIDGKLIKRNTTNFENIPNGFYILVDAENSEISKLKIIDK